MRLVKLLCTLVLLSPVATGFAQTGKIAGTVTDESGDPLPGVNVVIEGTQQGGTTDTEGYYAILNVAPGTYNVRASFIGFTPQVKQDVRVNIDLTAEVDFTLEEETVGMDEVVVVVERPVVKRDLSASRVDVTAEEMENLPVTDVAEVINLQAGVQGLQIRGSGSNEVAFRINGFGSTSRRNNEPYTGVSYAAVEEIQVQSGGFNAEYGDMRGGVVNVVTKEGPRDRYTGSAIVRYSAASKKHFGPSPSDPDSYWMKPYLDPEVAFEGTENWDAYTQRQYPQFDGFNQIAEDNPELGSAENAQDLFLFRHRRDLEIDAPDYVIDAGVGGPVPGISQYLGDLRFFASYRQEQSQYIIPLSTDDFDAYNGRLKLTSNLRPGMKLTLEGMRGQETGTNIENRNISATFIRRDGDRESIYGTNGLAGYGPAEDQIFGVGSISLSDIDYSSVGGRFTHSLSEKTFYDVVLQWRQTEYFTRPPRERNLEEVQCFGDLCVDEAPIGFSFESINSLTGMRMGAHWSEFRDTTQVSTWTGRFDLTSQVDRYNQVKIGAEIEFDNQDVKYGYPDFLLNPPDVYADWNETEIYGAVYAQDKLEFRGMIANVGLRLDYLNPNTDWWVYEDPFTEAFMGKNADEMDKMLDQEPVDGQLFLSPRVGVSFPVTETSKLYFNYGHFRQRPQPQNIYLLERMILTNQVTRISDPSAPLPRTVAYELGYEQSFFDQYLIRVAGYYKDIKDQPRWVSFSSRNGLVGYETNRPDDYEDTRGFEISLFKNRGRWVRGFINYTYMVETQGEFGFAQFSENRVEQREYERTTRDHYQSKPLPQPYARLNLDFIVPSDYGRLLGDWRLNILAWWQSGEYATFTGEANVPGIENNLRYKDYKMVDVRISKNFNLETVDLTLYADIQNVFNIKNFNDGAFYGPRDREDYLNSLHLPEEAVEGWEDQYQPRDENGNPIYGDDRIGELDKDYIDPPNGSSFHYLFPRDVYFGLRFNF